jgi:hypothetical protein
MIPWRARSTAGSQQPPATTVLHTVYSAGATGVAQASAEAVAEAVYEALTCNCECEQPTATALAQAAAKAEGGCGGVAQSLAGECPADLC